MPRTRRSRAGLFLIVFTPFLVVSIGSLLLEAEIARGAATPTAFGLLVAVFNLLLLPLARRLEGMVLGIEQRPWLSGRLSRSQRLILPYSTASVLTIGFGLSFAGASYLLSAPNGLNAVNAAATAACGAGGALMGFGLSRLAAGLFIVRFSGLWSAPKRAWQLGAAAVVLGTIAFGANSLMTMARVSESM